MSKSLSGHALYRQGAYWMNHTIKKMVGITSSILMLMGSCSSLQADSLSNEQQTMHNLQAEATQTYNIISQNQTHAQSLQSSIHSYSVSLHNVQIAIAQNHQQMSSISKQIQALDAQMKANQKTLAKDKLTLDDQIRMTYEDGSTSYLAVLFGATSLNDLLTRFQTLSIIGNAQKQLFNQVQALQARIAAQHHTQQIKYKDLANHETQLKSLQEADLLIQKKQHASFLDLQAKIGTETRRRTLLESQIQLTQAQIQQIQQETQQAQQLMQNSSYIQTATQQLSSANSSSLIRFAESFTGVPYVWGGTSPSGFDCSGYTQYVFRHFGIDINRTSEAQFAQGIPVSESQLQPGDLVFFSTYAQGATHVGIYIGNQLMVNAEDMGVSIDNISNSYWGPKYIGARRFIK